MRVEESSQVTSDSEQDLSGKIMQHGNFKRRNAGTTMVAGTGLDDRAVGNSGSQ